MHQINNPCILFYMPGDKTNDKTVRRFADAVGYDDSKKQSVLVLKCEKQLNRRAVRRRVDALLRVAKVVGINTKSIKTTEYVNSGVILTAMSVN